MSKHISKLLSYVLRHHPEEVHIILDENGYAKVDDLIENINTYKDKNITFADLEEIVDNNNKKRFAFNDDKTLIRASQGHSINVDVELEKKIPPDILFHGTDRKFLDGINEKGLLPSGRLYVHLSDNIETAKNVGKRHGNDLIVFSIDTKKMCDDGIEFFISQNLVWLVENVDKKYLNILEF